ncbi:MAG: hypothetical protein HRT44_00590 [Bdellovibrionales bacterium]|nr:hypothetical protein [Bdellovibrionales bacterium]NQZ17748.1 hypothetical protein [Bdellovibrionales bacterium]
MSKPSVLDLRFVCYKDEEFNKGDPNEKLIITNNFCHLTFQHSGSGQRLCRGDGTLDFICTELDTNAKPHNIFDFTLMYDKDSGKSGFDLISDDNLAKGNGDLVYKMKMTQFPFFGAEIFPAVQEVQGCEFAPVSITQESDTVMNIYFECDADGDAGYGNLTMNLETGVVDGQVNFPEGKSSLIYSLQDDTEIPVSCDFKL